jgi:glyoxalase family protein
MGGLHHVTAIAGNAARNLDFYTRVLGMRLVKKTVNFDDPETYHLYYGDETGRPGSILTFFPWSNAAAGRSGVGSVQEVLLRVPTSALSF